MLPDKGISIRTMIYSFEFITESDFEPAIGLHFFKLRMLPAENAFQHIIRSSIEITPDVKLNSATDGFGNKLMYGGYENEHRHFWVRTEGVVECGDYNLPEESPCDYYLYHTHLTDCNKEISRMASGSTALEIMHKVHDAMQYERFVTDNSTTATQALRKGSGVCQDYAHIMISACRSAGMHARYVNGLAEGEGESHAWVEVYEEGCWRGYDPTCNREIKEGYMKIAHGRDANDCPVNRGRFYQWTSEQMTVRSKFEIRTETEQQ